MSNSNAQDRAVKSRPYRLGKRAEKREATRRRIVEAAVELHGTLGPARTSVAQIAARAGVQRHTYYSHFPNERSLSLACSGLAMERSPLPDPERWLELPPGQERTRLGLAQFYDWFRENEGLAACILRDAEIDPLTAEMIELRMGPTLARAEDILAEGLDRGGRELLRIAMDFACWRLLKDRRSGGEAADLMSAAIWQLQSAGDQSSSSS